MQYDHACTDLRDFRYALYPSEVRYEVTDRRIIEDVVKRLGSAEGVGRERETPTSKNSPKDDDTFRAARSCVEIDSGNACYRHVFCIQLSQWG